MNQAQFVHIHLKLLEKYQDGKFLLILIFKKSLNSMEVFFQKFLINLNIRSIFKVIIQYF